MRTYVRASRLQRVSLVMKYAQATSNCSLGMTDEKRMQKGYFGCAEEKLAKISSAQSQIFHPSRNFRLCDDKDHSKCCAKLFRGVAKRKNKKTPPLLLSFLQLPSRSLLWRAMLQVLIKRTQEGTTDFHQQQVGKIARKCETFKEYCKAAFMKIGAKVPVSDNVYAKILHISGT